MEPFFVAAPLVAKPDKPAKLKTSNSHPFSRKACLMNSKNAPPEQDISGFTHLRTTSIAELNISLHQYRHRATGARYLHIEADDNNNMFAAGFKTTPSDSTGVAHILEHTVLCGSQKYPVRDPFFSMIRRSLNTFMNALTASDWTLYPFATCNRTDFYNLMGVYLDAVFFPLFRAVHFRQEWHDGPRPFLSSRDQGGRLQ